MFCLSVFFYLINARLVLYTCFINSGTFCQVNTFSLKITIMILSNFLLSCLCFAFLFFYFINGCLVLYTFLINSGTFRQVIVFRFRWWYFRRPAAVKTRLSVSWYKEMFVEFLHNFCEFCFPLCMKLSALVLSLLLVVFWVFRCFAILTAVEKTMTHSVLIETWMVIWFHMVAQTIGEVLLHDYCVISLFCDQGI